MTWFSDSLFPALYVLCRLEAAGVACSIRCSLRTLESVTTPENDLTDGIQNDHDGEREFVVYADPAQRPRIERRAVRVLLVTPEDQILMFQDSDPGLPEQRWWVIPGGGIDPGETEHQAAVREVVEETGCTITAEDLVGPIATRHAVHGYSDQVMEQDEAFYLARVPHFEVDISDHTADEQITLQTHRWWDRQDLSSTPEWIWPAELAELWDSEGRPETWPRDLGRQEESTLADVAAADDQVG